MRGAWLGRANGIATDGPPSLSHVSHVPTPVVWLTASVFAELHVVWSPGCRDDDWLLGRFDA